MEGQSGCQTEETAPQEQAQAKPWVVAGLGNPGRRYDNTRHNAGWDALDNLHKNLGAPKIVQRSIAAIAETEIAGRIVVLTWPKTFMNDSGGGILYVLRSFEAEPGNLIILCDDIHLETGRIRVRRKGSDGGHNGLRSIIATLQTQRFPRVRIGVGKPPSANKQVQHVLQSPNREERERITAGAEKASEAVETIINSGIEEAMQSFN